MPLTTGCAGFLSVQAVVAVPVRDEAERIADCLLALAQQDGPSVGVVLLVNNTADTTMGVVADVATALETPVVVIEHQFPPGCASAGAARRLAMMHAGRLAPATVPLLCTDADGRVELDWIESNLHHLRHGADAVFGRAIIDPVEAERIPPAVREADRHECAYAAALDEIAHWIDPEPHDPWPRHAEHSGASIAVSRAMFGAVGGIPNVAMGEDRAFAAALRRAGARIRHAPEVRVVVSGRILGRAEGGMADTIRRRLIAPDPLLDDALEPLADRLFRLHRRRSARLRCAAAGVPFGAAWAIEDAIIPSRRLAVMDLPFEMNVAERVLACLRLDAVETV
jgi:GT2 family glycosyltransferase